jgi:predicted metal-dependent phosphoesterase TrpH
VKIDLHLHTTSSFDGWSSAEVLVRTAVSVGLDKIAITDHNTTDGAIAASRDYPGRVIVGEEVSCRCGTDLIGLFLSEHVDSGLTIEETAAAIRGQGGIVYGPHPFAYVTKSASRAERVAAVSDVMEVFNSRAFLPRWNRRALTLAQRLGLPTAASSDAHFHWELGRAYTELPDFETADQFRHALLEARPVGLRTGSALLHVASWWAAGISRLKRGPLAR